MSSELVSVRNAVVAALNAAAAVPDTFSLAFTAVPKYVPIVNLDEIGDALVVTVIPRTYDRVLKNRGGAHTKEVDLDIGLQKRLKAETTDPTDPAKLAEVDALLSVAEEIADWFGPGQIGSTGFYYRKATIPNPIYDPTVMREHHAFLSRVTVNFFKP